MLEMKEMQNSLFLILKVKSKIIYSACEVSIMSFFIVAFQ